MDSRRNNKKKEAVPHASRAPPDLTCKLKLHAVESAKWGPPSPGGRDQLASAVSASSSAAAAELAAAAEPVTEVKAEGGAGAVAAALAAAEPAGLPEVESEHEPAPET